MNKLLQFSFLFALGVFTLFTSCEKEEVNLTEDVEYYVNSSVFDMEEKGNCGRFGCYSFVFPISIQLPDSSIVEVEDYENLRTTIRDWKESNPDAEARPQLAFPLEVMDEEGNIISVSTRAELRELRIQCRKDFFKNKRDKRGKHRGEICFRLVFPVQVALPDGSTATVTNPRELQQEIRSWKAANPDSDERPGLVFPIQVEYPDGTVVEVTDQEALKGLKEDCAADTDG